MSEQGIIPTPERRRLHRAVAADTRARKQADITKKELIDAIKAAQKAGGSVRVIAAETGRAPKTIQTYLHTPENMP